MAECFDDDYDYMEVNENSNLELRKLIALQNKQISSQNERLQKLKNIALVKYHQIDKKGSKNIKPENKED